MKIFAFQASAFCSIPHFFIVFEYLKLFPEILTVTELEWYHLSLLSLCNNVFSTLLRITKRLLFLGPRLLRTGSVDDEYEHERETTWSELFFDLVYVVAIARLGQHLREGRIGISSLLLYFLMIWSFWFDTVYFATRFGDNALPNMIFFAGMMIGVTGMSANLGGDERSDVVEPLAKFAAFSSLCLICVHLRLAADPPSDRSWRYVKFMLSRFVVYFIGWVLLGSSLFDANRTAQGVFFWVLVVGYIAVYPFICVSCWPCLVKTEVDPEEGEIQQLPWYNRDFLRGKLVLFDQHPYVPIHLEHYTERLGLLVIIFLGESISSIVPATNDQSALLYVRIFLAFGIVWCLKTLYFEADVEDFSNHALHVSRFSGIAFSNSHIITNAGILLFSSGLELAVSSTHNEHVDQHALVCGGLAATLAGMLIARIAHRREWMVLGNREATEALPQYELKLFQRLRTIFFVQLVVELCIIAICATLPVMTDLESLGNTSMLAILFVLSLTLVVSNLMDEMVESAHHRRYHQH